MKLKSTKIKIIAEIGVNHNGKLSNAKKLITAARNAGADYVKFQIFDPDEMVTKNSLKAKYQTKSLGKSISQYEMLKKYYLGFKEMKILYKFCKEKKINFLASIFDIKSLNFLKKLNVDYIKLPSSEINNYFLLNALSKQKKKIIYSTGMATFEEIKTAYNILKKNKNKILPMYCVSSYPTSLREINFKNFIRLKNLSKEVGFSDHTISNESSIIASYLGASVIERHITLDKKNKGPDHSASLDTKEFSRFVESVRNVEMIITKTKKNKERENLKYVRKYLVAKNEIKIGDTFSESNLTAKRSGGGLNPFKFRDITGKKSKKKYKIDQIIKL